MKSFKLKTNEPIINNNASETEITEAFNEYFMDFTEKQAFVFLLEFLDKNGRYKEAELIKKSYAPISLTACWIARMLSRGINLPNNYYTYLEENIKELKDSAQEKNEENKMSYITVKNKTELLKNKAYGTIETLENLVKNNPNLDVYKFLYDNSISDKISEFLSDYFSSLLEEISLIKDDEKAAEAYSNLSIEELQDKNNLYTRALKEIGIYRKFLSLQNKPIHEEKVEIPDFVEFKYLKSFKNIISKTPEDIQGANIVWKFDTKYNYLHCIRGQSLSTIRSRIQGEDLSISWARIVKKDFDDIYNMIMNNIDPEIIREKIKNKTEYRPIVMCNEFSIILNIVK